MTCLKVWIQQGVDLMAKYIIRRILVSAFVLFGLIVITFTLTRIIPTDPAAKWVGPRATAEQIAAARIKLGLDEPVFVQFGKYITDILHGDLGYSLVSHKPVTEELLQYLPATLELIIVGTFLGVIIGIPLGLYSAKNKNSWFDHICRFFSVGAVSLPSFWIALMLQLIFYGWLGWLPVGSRVSLQVGLMYDLPDITGLLLLDSLITGNMVIFKDALRHIILPAIPLAMFPIGYSARMTRSALLEILNEDYIIAARSYGLKERLILWVYAFKNSLGPTVTVLTMTVATLLVGTFLIEVIFSWPGMGRYIGNAILSFDFPAIMGVTLLTGLSYTVFNLIADILMVLDPRIRL